MAGSIREMSSEMGDNHGNFDLILISKRESFDPNLKRGTFDKGKYLRNCDVTIIVGIQFSE